jgi:hypothetical protein
VALLLILKKQDFAAGAILALSTAKPQMVFLLIPFILLWAISSARRDIIAGTLITGAILLGISIALIPSWPLQWLQQLIDYPSYTMRIGSPVSVIASAVPGIQRTVNLVLNASLIAYMVLEWFLAWGKDKRWFLWTACMTMVITNLIAYRTATTNYVMLIPALFLIFKTWEDRWGIYGAAGTWLSLLLLGVGLWLLFINTVQGNEEQAIMYLPLPIFTLVGMLWVRWWAVRPPKVLLEALSAKVK